MEMAPLLHYRDWAASNRKFIETDGGTTIKSIEIWHPQVISILRLRNITFHRSILFCSWSWPWSGFGSVMERLQNSEQLTCKLLMGCLVSNYYFHNNAMTILIKEHFSMLILNDFSKNLSIACSLSIYIRCWWTTQKPFSRQILKLN